MAAKPYLSVCGIYWNEAPYLREWLEFHRQVGVEHFFLYNNRSTDNHREVLAPFVDDGFAEIRDWDVFPGQLEAYADCLERHRQDSQWIAFIDIDEFLFSPLGLPVPEIVGEFEEHPAVGAHWCTFGDSGHDTKPPGLVIENYVMRSTEVNRNWAIKSIVQPTRTVSAGNNPHYFEYDDHSHAVNENHEPMTGALGRVVPHIHENPVFERLRLNHYVTKSKEERRAKLARPIAFNGKFKNAEHVMKRDVELNQVRDETILMYLPALKEELARLPAPAAQAQA
jgi:hypothetical protein